MASFAAPAKHISSASVSACFFDWSWLVQDSLATEPLQQLRQSNPYPRLLSGVQRTPFPGPEKHWGHVLSCGQLVLEAAAVITEAVLGFVAASGDVIPPARPFNG